MKKYSEHILEAKDEIVTLSVEISNLQPHQAEELKNLLFAFDAAGSLGCSREFKCFVDGDGAFRPKVTIDEKVLKDQKLGKNVNFDNEILEFSFE